MLVSCVLLVYFCLPTPGPTHRSTDLNGSPRLHGKVASVGTTQLRPIVISANSEHTTPRSASQRVAWCTRADAVWDFKRVCWFQRPRGESKRSAIESQLHPPYVLVLGSRATQADSTYCEPLCSEHKNTHLCSNTLSLSLSQLTLRRHR